MDLSSKKIEFIHFLSSNWNLQETSLYPEPPFAHNLLFCGKKSWINLLCYKKTKDFAPNSIQLCQLLQSYPSSIFVFCHEEQRSIDIYAKSILDPSPVIVHDLDWKNSSDFSSLAQLDSYLEFAFELERRFGKKRMERKFVSDFRNYTQQLAQSWTGLHDDSPEIRYQLALTTLIRLFFVSFLETRGTFDSRKCFLQEEALKCVIQNVSIFQNLIQPLFFETLNRPEHRRTKRAKALGHVPFLNGGLFTATELEINAPHLNVSNDLILEIITDLFEQYTLRCAHSESDLRPVLDPMMLGHVFESLMSPEKRSMTGSYYTPIPLARQLVITTISHWMMQEFSLEQEQVRLMCIEHDFSSITKERATEIDARLSELTILDPASGSGAFLQCTFSLIHKLRTGLNHRAGISIHPGTLARQILTRNLYGVDILPEASQICELRLWLELIHYFDIDETLPPLPNLDMNIRCGNTLTDLSQYNKVLGIAHQPLLQNDEIAHLRHRYKLSTGFTKKKLANEIDKKIHQSGKTLLQTYIDACDQECRILEKPVPSLFESTPVLSRIQRQRLITLKQQREKLMNCIQNEVTPGFCFDLHFSDIVEDGGFDIVLGNPPWYSLHTMPNETQQVLKTLYQTASPIKGSGSQASDISALFVEKALQCVRTNGLVAMLIPNKLFHAPSYENFRKHITTNSHILHIKDWSNEAFNAFDATTYPASIILKKTSVSTGLQQVTSHEQSSIFQEKSSTPLDNVQTSISHKFIIKRGLCTGANNIFVAEKTGIEQGCDLSFLKFPQIPSPILIETELIHPVLRGANLSAFQAIPTDSIIFTHNSNEPALPLTNLPKHAQHWFSQNKTTLTHRKGLGKHPFHALFGCSNHLRSMKVVWKDISYNLEACFIKDPEILPLNTVYYIPVETETQGYLLAAYLNSSMARKYCRNHAESARGDYRRYFAWVIGKLPWFLDQLPQNANCHLEKIIALSKACPHATPDSLKDYQQQIDELLELCLKSASQYKSVRRQQLRQLPLHMNNPQEKIS